MRQMGLSSLLLTGFSLVFLSACVPHSNETKTPHVTDASLSQAWSCRNKDVEISCDSAACLVAQGSDFTPMDLTLSKTGEISLCAYSGCWEGQAKTITTEGQFLSLIGSNLLWSGSQEGTADMAITLNKASQTATLLMDSYAHPMTCDTL